MAGSREAGIVDQELGRLASAWGPRAAPGMPSGGAESLVMDGTRLAIGRDPSNDVVLDDPNVSQFHAEVRVTSEGLELKDLGSRNGTRLNGELTDRAKVYAGATIGVGSLRLIFDGAGFLARDDYGLVRLDATGLAVRIRQKQILASATVSLGPGELVGIIGESGAGKTTLLKVLAGVRQPSSGQVTVNGEPLVSRLTDIGYVPQEEVDHDGLTIYEALTYSARLRLPDDASSDQIQARVHGVLDELALSDHAHTRVGSLSGGQRRRANVATELLGRPSLLLLDEPTTGMDPWLETKMMNVFRQLADHSRGVALVTHATKSLALCDRIAVLSSSGVLVFDGSPAQARRFFGVDGFDGIYQALKAMPEARPHEPTAAARTERSTVAPPRATTATTRPRRRPRRNARRQTGILARRYATVMRRDRRNMLLLLLQPAVLGLAGGGLFAANVFSRPSGKVGDAIEVLFLATLVMVWVGSINGAREIIRERGIFNRESALGVRLVAYLSSKLIVLFGLMVIQTLLYAGVLFAFVPLHADAGVYLAVFALLVLTGFVAVAMGLFISAAVNTEAQATTVLPLAFIPQLIFAGAIVPVASMAGPAHALAAVTFARWSLAASGTAADMNARMAESSGFARVTSFGAHFFNVAVGAGLLIQAAFLTLLLAGTSALLRR